MQEFNIDFEKKIILQIETDSFREHFRPSYILIRHKERLVLSIFGILDTTNTIFIYPVNTLLRKADLFMKEFFRQAGSF